MPVRVSPVALTVSWLLLLGSVATGADKIAGMLTVKDVLTAPGRTARIEARLVRAGLFTDVGLGGEPLELVVEGKAVATAMTGGDGRAFLEYRSTARGTYPITVRMGATQRVTAEAAVGAAAVWEKRRPLLMVDVAALMEETNVSPIPSFPGGLASGSQPKPLPDAAGELTKLTQFYYNVIYLLWSGEEGGPIQEYDAMRLWLTDHQFPRGIVMAAKPSPAGLHVILNELKTEGWTTLKTGIVRSRIFAEVLLEHRIEAVLVPEPSRGDAPRKAKTAKHWKDIRKKL